LKLIDFHLLLWRAQQRLLAVLEVVTSMFKTSAQLRLENPPRCPTDPEQYNDWPYDEA
jgi:hypothetical protein